jgi:hypothetical protein
MVWDRVLSGMTETPDQDKPLHGAVNAAGDGQVIPETKAKQGGRGRHMMVVLGVSVALAAVVMIGVWGVSSGALSKAQHAGGPRRDSVAGAPHPDSGKPPVDENP